MAVAAELAAGLERGNASGVLAMSAGRFCCINCNNEMKSSKTKTKTMHNMEMKQDKCLHVYYHTPSQ